MGKTPVLLAFGRHWDTAFGGIIQPDRRFYRAAALPFIDRRVVAEGRKAVHINEYRLVVDGFGNDDVERASSIAVQLEEHEKSVLATMRAAWDQGLPAPGGLNHELDWGLLHRIIELNRGSPGRVRSLIERQTPGQVLLAYAFETPTEGLNREEARLARWMDSIRSSIAISKHRSQEVLRLIEALRREEPAAAIIVTRGYAHAGMAAWFDPERFEVESHAGGELTPRFSSDAIIESYSHDLGEAELRRYAMLNMISNDELDARWGRGEYAPLLEGMEFAAVVQKAKADAKEYALGVVGAAPVS